MIFFEFLVAVLATWYIVYTVQNLDAPFNLAGKMRKRLRIGEHDDGKIKPGSFRKLMSCFKCLSFWVSLPFANHITGGFFPVLALTLAIAAAAIFVQDYAEQAGM